MGFAQDLINKITLEEHIKKREEKEAIELEVEEEFLLAFEQEAEKGLSPLSAQRLIDAVK